jgi:hypothetical protein
VVGSPLWCHMAGPVYFGVAAIAAKAAVFPVLNSHTFGLTRRGMTGRIARNGDLEDLLMVTTMPRLPL